VAPRPFTFHAPPRPRARTATDPACLSLPPPRFVDDRELLARLARGDEAAYDAIFRAWYAPLVRATQAVVRDAAVAEELVQDAMLELWRRREQLDAEGSPQAYLFRATRNRALNHLRHLAVQRKSASVLRDDEARDASAPDELVAAELEAAVKEAIAGLPPRCREVFALSRERGLKYAEIADTLGVSVKAVEANMGRALRILRTRLARWLPEGREL
jgi:RNA polymerase sigma-70 factor (ECF subfamily)